MSYVAMLGHVTVFELPQFSLYMVFAFVLGVSVAMAAGTRTETNDADDDE